MSQQSIYYYFNDLGLSDRLQMFSNGKEAVIYFDRILSDCKQQRQNVVNNQPVSLILLDINMPIMTGIEAITIIKQKYEEKLYVRGYAADQHEIFADLEAAIGAHSLFDLLQVFGEMSSHGIELTDPLPTSVRK